MKTNRYLVWLTAVAAALAFAVAFGLAEAKPKKGATLTVRVLRAKVMKKPKFIGAVAGTVSRGATLTYKGSKGQWYEVEGDASGWLHKGQVLEGALTLSSKPGKAGSSASRDEVELAGRGFTPQVEKEYQRKNPKMDFAHVDAIENAELDPGELEQFVAAGDL